MMKAARNGGGIYQRSIKPIAQGVASGGADGSDIPDGWQTSEMKPAWHTCIRQGFMVNAEVVVCIARHSAVGPGWVANHTNWPSQAPGMDMARNVTIAENTENTDIQHNAL